MQSINLNSKKIYKKELLNLVLRTAVVSMRNRIQDFDDQKKTVNLQKLKVCHSIKVKLKMFQNQDKGTAIIS
jgi:hypothetical protein